VILMKRGIGASFLEWLRCGHRRNGRIATNGPARHLAGEGRNTMCLESLKVVAVACAVTRADNRIDRPSGKTISFYGPHRCPRSTNAGLYAPSEGAAAAHGQRDI